jgi:hypothetical protein
MNGTLETVAVDLFGTTKQNFVINPSWPAGYAAYRAGYEAATDKAKFNSEYLKGKP